MRNPARRDGYPRQATAVFRFNGLSMVALLDHRGDLFAASTAHIFRSNDLGMHWDLLLNLFLIP
jgi:hypothetical protein